MEAFVWICFWAHALIFWTGRCQAVEAANRSRFTYDFNFTDEQRLLYYLLKNYEKAVRPVRNASNSIVVKLGLTLTNIFDMDEKNQVLTTNVWLDQEWNDELLRWNPADFNNISQVRIPCDFIWLPDIVLYNNADDYATGYMRSRAMVQYDGTVFWPPPTQLRSTCKIDVTYFPFDSQRCFLKFGSWTYHGLQVDVMNRSEGIDLSNYVVSGEFELIKTHQKRRIIKYSCCVETYPDVTFFIHVRRKTLYYMYNVVFPCMMMSALTLLVFCLPPDSGEKIALGITVLLAFSVFVLAIAEKMPETSDSMPLIGIYLTVVMGMTSVSVVMTVMILNFHHRGPFHKEIPPWIRGLVLQGLRRFLCMKLPYPNLRPERNCGNGAATGADSSFLRRLSLKMTIENLQEELIRDMGLNAESTSPTCNYESTGVSDKKHRRRSRSVLSLQRRAPNGDAANSYSPLFVDETVPFRLNTNTPTVCTCNHKSGLQKEVLKTLQMLISRQELDDECEEIANEWRQVAQVIDRLLFWLFLVATVLITLILLIIIPVVHHYTERLDLDERLYGITQRLDGEVLQQ